MFLRHTVNRSIVSSGRKIAGFRQTARINKHIAARRAKAGSSAAPSAIKGLLEWLESLRALLASALLIILMIVSLLIVYRAAAVNVFTVEAFLLPSDLSKQGWSGELLAQNLAGNLQRMYQRALTSREFKFPAVKSQWSQADFQVPGAGVSIQTAARQIRALLGLPEKRIRGVITYDGHYWGITTYDSDGGIHRMESEANTPEIGQRVAVHDVIDELLHRSAVALLLSTDPYVLAVSSFDEEKDECNGARGKPAEEPACKFENTQNAIQQVLDKRDPDAHRWALILQARLLLEKGQLESAIEAYKLGQVLYPKFAPVFYSEGYAYFSHNQYDKAIPLLTRAVELDGSHASSRYYLAKALADHNSLEEAEKHFDEVIELGKGMEPLARMELGIIHHRRGNYSMATDELRQTALLLPRNPDALVLWGCSLLDQGRSQEASRMFLAALKKQRELAELYNTGSVNVESLIIVRLVASRKPDKETQPRGIFDTCISGSVSQSGMDSVTGH